MMQMEKATILIADDEYNTRLGIYYTLEKHLNGQAVIKMAANGVEAWELIERESYDLLITDIRMPGYTGIELLDKIKEAGMETTALLLTGFAEFDYAREGLRLGAVDYLLKPVDREKLVESVHRALELNKERKRSSRVVKQWAQIHGGQPELPEGHVKNEGIAKAIAYMQQHLNEENSVKVVAQAVNLSPSYFSVLFKESTGLTFSEYLNKLRQRKSKELLLTTDLDVNLIADEVGYQSSSYFIRVFRETEGVTPKQYREQVRKEQQ